ncbi:MAG: hypothetical protein Q9M22_06410 [Mariprofundaceae bacterium]|nr:hypothetical protein [Mariprofundaceae bacterium]
MDKPMGKTRQSIKYTYLFSIFVLIMTFSNTISEAKEKKNEYLYFKTMVIAPYQNMREFFDMPDRSGRYEVSLLSDAMTPLTMHIVRMLGEEEKTINKQRSFHLGDHRLQYHFNNPKGIYDLAVEVANSNPTMKITVSIIVVELPDTER